LDRGWYNYFMLSSLQQGIYDEHDIHGDGRRAMNEGTYTQVLLDGAVYTILHI
jgi:hypothetical protein